MMASATGCRVMARAVRAVTALITLAACGSKISAQPPAMSAATRPIHAEIRDSSVDTLPDSRVPVSPDLVFAIVDVDDAQVVFRFRYRPGTYEPATTRLEIDLDADQDAASGTAGVEYLIVVFPSGGRGAEVTRAMDGGYVMTGTAPVGYVEDGCDVAVPRALLGDEDGRFDFRVRVYAEQALPAALDTLPDIGFARVQ